MSITEHLFLKILKFMPLCDTERVADFLVDQLAAPIVLELGPRIGCGRRAVSNIKRWHHSRDRLSREFQNETQGFTRQSQHKGLNRIVLRIDADVFHSSISA